jgi:uncharacterized surface protein with fasciclin (FAS1) repeats
MIRILRLYPAIIFCLISFSFSSCEKKSSVDYPPSAVSVYEIITEDSYNFSYFKFLVDQAGQADLLKTGNHTFFLPDNNAFLAAGFNIPAMQLMSTDSLIMMVKNHVVEGKMDINSLSPGQELTAMSDDRILINKVGEDVYIDGGNVTNANENATNGIVHVINKVLVKRMSILDRLNNYTNTTSNSQFTFLTAALNRASQGSTNFISMLSDPAANYTLFAPNNGAFIDGGYASLAAVSAAVPDTLGKILKRHILTGRQLVPDFDSSKPQTSLGNSFIYFDRLKPGKTTSSYANGISFYGGSADMFGGSSGVIHSVSRFIPEPIATTTLARIQSDTALSFFNAALTKASQQTDMDFVKMLSDATASYTVFAVTNNGFRSAGYSNINAVNNESAAALNKMMKLHMVNKRINNINIAENGTVATLLTTTDAVTPPDPVSLTFTFKGGFKVKGPSNTATITVTTANIVTTNGLLNIIGSILLP